MASGGSAGASAGGSAAGGSTAGGSTAGGSATPLGALSLSVHVNHLGWRPNDTKTVLLLGHAGESVQLRRVADNSIALTVTAGPTVLDEDSQDQVAEANFTSLSTPGDYYAYLPSSQLRSYPFRIAPDVYDVVARVAMKMFFFQRCNHSRGLPYASDVVSGTTGAGGQWIDGACHLGDGALTAGPGSANDGTLDLRGGWHDAGDYQKTLWARGVPELLFAYELHPTAWLDGQLNLPESANGIPDLLDEVKWELDFYVRMQRPDGHFLTSAKGIAPATNPRSSPPSVSNEARVYFDGTSPDGNGWSGGGVTPATATGNAVLSLAHAATVFRAAGQTTIGDGYATAAALGWSWLNTRTLSGAERRLRAAAASAVHRMDPTNTSARTVTEGFPWDTFDGLIPYQVTPGESVLSTGAFHLLLNASATATVKTKARTGLTGAIVTTAFQQAGAYGGLFGSPGNNWDTGWGSNRNQGAYGAHLLMAARLGVLGSHTQAELETQGQKYAHYLLGRNPLNMLYLTNMARYGGEHSSFQMYHSWFSYTNGDGDHGNVTFNGKPTSVDEPMYPYHPGDAQTSLHGPAPGFVVGGPNPAYSGTFSIPNLSRPAYAYRDFSVACAWNGSACTGSSWEITEPMDAYQGPVVLLLSLLMSN